MIDDLVRIVGGEQIERRCLIGSGLDPHSYELVKGDAELLTGAQLIFYGGLGLEHGPSLAHHLTTHSNAASIGGYLKDRCPERIIVWNGEPDPHLWTDVGLWAQGIGLIVERLEQLDPVHGVEFRERGEHLRAQLEAVDREVAAQLAQIPEDRRYLISCHRAFHYFVRAYLATDEERANGGWLNRADSPEGISPEAEMSLSDIQRVVNFALEHRVPVLFAESNINVDPLLKIVDVLGHRGLKATVAQPLHGDAMPAGSTYEEMARHNAHIVCTSLGVSQ
jgi:manganese/zinc/iron transport system substrate-binding protein